MFQKNPVPFLPSAGRVSAGLSLAGALNGAHSPELPQFHRGQSFPYLHFYCVPAAYEGTAEERTGADC